MREPGVDSTGLGEAARTRRVQERLAALLNPRSTPPPPPGDPTLAALSAVGRALGVEVRTPPPGTPVEEGDAVGAIARASRLRQRRVLLSPGWWRRHAGTLLGWLAADRRPVALCPRRSGGYELLDPSEGRIVRVEGGVAAALSPEAVSFYRPAPAQIRSPLALLRFTLRGRGQELQFALLLAVATTLMGFVAPLATGVVVGQAIPDANRGLLLELGAGLLAAAFGMALLALAQGVLAVRVGLLAEVDAQAAVWDRVLRLPVSVLRRFSTGDLLDRAMAASDLGRDLNGVVLRTVLTGAMSLLSLGLLVYWSPTLAAWAALLAAGVGAATLAAGHAVRPDTRRLLALAGPLFGLVVQLVGAVGKLRVAAAERRAFLVWLERRLEVLGLLQGLQATHDRLTVFNQVVPTVSLLVLFCVGMGQIEAGRSAAGGLTVGTFLAFSAALGTLMAGATSLSNTLVDLLDSALQVERLVPLLEAAPEVDAGKVEPGRLGGTAALERVDFRYPGDARRTLSEVSLELAPGELVALVGPSGSGKSTVLRLLLGFEAPASGIVTYDGQDLAGLDVSAVRRQLGVVLQGGQVQAGSIRDNLAAGRLIGHDAAWAALEDAGFADEVRQMPMGLHTMVSEGGGNLSGGQRQRLLLARVLVRDPRILLLDEATSALDNRTQAFVSERLARRRVSRLVIAHRLSTVRHADRIYVLDRGRVVEVGTYDELLAAGELFARMAARQMA